MRSASKFVVIPMLMLGLTSGLNAQTNFVLNSEFARKFAEEWIESWNSHDMERVLSHYTDDFLMSSLRIPFLGFDESGTLQGKTAMREYWGPALTENSQAHMTLDMVLLAPNSITIYYHSRTGRQAAEVLIFNEVGLVKEAIAHYDIDRL